MAMMQGVPAAGQVLPRKINLQNLSGEAAPAEFWIKIVPHGITSILFSVLS